MACFESSESTSESTRQFRLNGCDLFRWNKPLNEMKIFIICSAVTENSMTEEVLFSAFVGEQRGIWGVLSTKEGKTLTYSWVILCSLFAWETSSM